MFYYEIKLKNTNLGSFEVASISEEAMRLIYEYLRESLLTDGKRPVKADEHIILMRFLDFYEQTRLTKIHYEQSGLD
jgi:hypothetical protein